MEATIIKTGAKVMILDAKINDDGGTVYLIAPVGSKYAKICVGFISAAKVAM